MTPLVCIDPGAQGGMAFRCADGIISAWKMPDGMTAQVDCLRELAANHCGLQAITERVGSYVKGNAVGGAVRFARHCGNLEATLYALGIPTLQPPAPQTWQKYFGALPDGKEQRKRAIREAMARLYPHLSVTLATADALGILTWKINNKHEESR